MYLSSVDASVDANKDTRSRIENIESITYFIVKIRLNITVTVL